MSAKRSKEASELPSGNPNNIKLESVNPLWLDVSPQDRYLLPRFGFWVGLSWTGVAPVCVWRCCALEWLNT